MKRLVLAVALAVAATVLASGSALAAPDDAKGPPCANITSYGAQTDYYNPAANPDLQFTIGLAARSCESITYTLEIYDLSGTTLLATVTQTGTGSSSTVVFNYNFTGTAPSDGVCVVATTSRRGNVLDRAPNTGCAPMETGGAGGGGGFD
jgi:hypothetical protein